MRAFRFFLVLLGFLSIVAYERVIAWGNSKEGCRVGFGSEVRLQRDFVAVMEEAVGGMSKKGYRG